MVPEDLFQRIQCLPSPTAHQRNLRRVPRQADGRPKAIRPHRSWRTEAQVPLVMAPPASWRWVSSTDWRCGKGGRLMLGGKTKFSGRRTVQNLQEKSYELFRGTVLHGQGISHVHRIFHHFNSHRTRGLTPKWKSVGGLAFCTQNFDCSFSLQFCI